MRENRLKRALLLIILQIMLSPVYSFAQEEYITTKIWSLHSKPIVKAQLNGKPAYFLLDTGSDINILNNRGAKKYSFAVSKKSPSDGFKLATINGFDRNILLVYDIKMEMQGRNIPCTFYSIDINSIVRSVQVKTGITIAGIIGSNTMKTFTFIIDYEKEQITMKMGKGASVH